MRLWLLCSLIAGLSACSYHLQVDGKLGRVVIDESQNADSSILTLIQPYKDSLVSQMSEIIGKADTSFELGTPCSNLMNWSADALFVQETQNVRLSEPIFCLLNAGGLRSSLSKGDLTVGDLYKLMPFDNTVTWVRLPLSRIEAIENFMKNQPKGVPLANATFNHGKLMINGLNENHTHFWVITSDYLAQGGDKMTFFLNPESLNVKSKTLRDVFIDEVRRQGTLISNLEIRFIP